MPLLLYNDLVIANRAKLLRYLLRTLIKDEIKMILRHLLCRMNLVEISPFLSAPPESIMDFQHTDDEVFAQEMTENQKFG